MSEHTSTSEHSGILFTILVLILYAVTGLFVYKTYFIPGYKEIQNARLTVSELQQEIERYKSENKKLMLKIQALKDNDPAAWENATRKYLGWVKPGEIVIEAEK
jgi:cell division protein FtsB